MVESMVERVARAICDGRWDAEHFNETANGEEPEEQREYWRGIARAAIEAMREPTDAMVEAGFDAGDDTVQGYSENADPQDTWQSMIDAAINEQVSG